jgi:hypothetical protein
VLANGRQTITLAANSRLSVAPDSSDGLTRIIEDLGSALFQVDHRSAPHFRVDTPLLAAVVKGTTFTVSADGERDSVHVVQGLVEVRSNANGQASDVSSGATAQVTRGGEGGVHLIAPSSTASLGQSARALPALNYAAVSDGVLSNQAPAEGADSQGSGGDIGVTAAGMDLANAGNENGANGNAGNGNGGAGGNGDGNGNGNGGGNGGGGGGGNGNGNNGNGNGGGDGNGNGGLIGGVLNGLGGLLGNGENGEDKPHHHGGHG